MNRNIYLYVTLSSLPLVNNICTCEIIWSYRDLAWSR